MHTYVAMKQMAGLHTFFDVGIALKSGSRMRCERISDA